MDTVVVTNNPMRIQASVQAKGLTINQVMGLSGTTVVANAKLAGHRVVAQVSLKGSSGDVSEPWQNLATVTAIAPGFSRMAAVEKPSAGGSKRCDTMLSYPAAVPQWQSCIWRPVEFSPDGSRVLAVPSRSAQTGIQDLAVLDATTGRVLEQFTTAGAFGRATFENDQAVDAVLTVGRRAGIVRCTVGGRCERATPTSRIPAGGSAALVTPYQITAN